MENLVVWSLDELRFVIKDWQGSIIHFADDGDHETISTVRSSCLESSDHDALDREQIPL